MHSRPHADASDLLQHTHIKGLAAKLAGFEGIVEDIRHRPYQLLDFEATQFDRDFLEFNVHIHDLELTLQACTAPLQGLYTYVRACVHDVPAVCVITCCPAQLVRLLLSMHSYRRHSQLHY